MTNSHKKPLSLVSDTMGRSNILGDNRADIAFMARLLVLATMPHNDPGHVEAWGRSNGHVSLTIQPYVKIENGKPKNFGLPYGTIPRLLMIWLTTEAVRTKERKLVLGSSLKEFMEKLDMAPTGGRWGSITRLREQMNRLFKARISYSCETEYLDEFKSRQISSEHKLFWNHKTPEQIDLFESYILLDHDFFKELISRPVPLDMEAISALRKSPLGLDLYVWLTYRVSYLKKPQPIAWATLQEQFGSDYADPKEFARKAKRLIGKIQVSYPELKVDLSKRGRLILYPSPTHIPKQIG